jgi:hypothetical protein
MKHQMLLKSFLILALLGAMHSASYASEVTGTLSSGGGNAPAPTQPGGEQNTGEPSSSTGSTGTPDDGEIAGSVSGGSSSNSGGNGSGGTSGEVLGENTMAATPSPAPLSSDSSTSRLSQTTTTNGNATSETNGSLEVMPADIRGQSVSYEMVPVPPTASILGAFSEFSAASWFWIIALSLLLISVIAYIYNHESERPLARTTTLRY